MFYKKKLKISFLLSCFICINSFSNYLITDPAPKLLIINNCTVPEVSDFNNWNNPSGEWTVNNTGTAVRNEADNISNELLIYEDIDFSIFEGKIVLNFNVRTNGISNIITSSQTATFELRINNTTYVTINNPSGGTIAPVTVANGATSNLTSIPITKSSGPYTSISVTLPNPNIVGDLVFSFTANGDDFHFQNFGFSADTRANSCKDSDSDGVLDVVDIDDDNDGVLDVAEGCEPFDAPSEFDAYWPMDNTTDDKTGAYNAVSGTNSFSTDAVKGSSSASFNGTSDGIQYSNGTFLNQQISNFTHAFWFKADDVNGTQTLLDEGGSTNGIGIRLVGNTLEGVVEESFVRFTSTFADINANQWYHVALTYNNGDYVFYLDGIANPIVNTGFGSLASHGNASGLGYTNSSDAFGGSASNNFDGLIDDVYHYPITLTTTQVQELKDSLRGNCKTTIDTDGDSIPNHLDLDSDGDGCPDTAEASLPLTNNDLQNGTVVNISATTTEANTQLNPDGTDVNNDGLNDSVDTNTDGIPDYQSTYAVYALVNTNSTCTDSDNDGVPDITDIDDDNDGVLDITEGCYVANAPAGFDAYWPMDNTTDDQANSFDAKSGTNTFNTDAVLGSHSASFNGTSDGIQYNDGTFLNQEITNFTHAFWFKADDVNGIQTLLDEGGATNGVAIRLSGNSISASVEENSTRFIRTFNGIIPNKWYHVALTYNNGDAVFYLDGVASTVMNTNYGALAIHADDSGLGFTNNHDAFDVRGTGNYFDGLIDDVYHYPINLTGSQVNELKNSINSNCNNAIDTDGDMIPDYLDLDSDGDGCPDTIEAGIANANTDLVSANIVNGDGITNTSVSIPLAILKIDGTDNNNDGLNDSVDINTDGIVDYTSTYTTNALSNTQNNCSVDLSVTKTVDKAVPTLGGEVIFTITLKNSGIFEASGIQVKDILPAGLTYNASNSQIPLGTAYDGTTGIWNLETKKLPTGESISLKLAAKVIIKGTIIVNQSEVFKVNQSDKDSTSNSGD